MDGWNTSFLFGMAYFQVRAASFRECLFACCQIIRKVLRLQLTYRFSTKESLGQPPGHNMSTLEPITQELKINVIFCLFQSIFQGSEQNVWQQNDVCCLSIYVSRNKYIFGYFRYCFNSLVAVRHGFPSRANPPASLILHPRFGYQPIHKGLLLTSDKELLEASPEKSLDHINVYI